MKEAITHFQCAAGAYAYLDVRFLYLSMPDIHMYNVLFVIDTGAVCD